MMLFYHIYSKLKSVKGDGNSALPLVAWFAFGKGVIAAKFFKKGDPKKFCERKLGFKDFIPQILVVLIPLIVGIALLVSRGFNLPILIAMIYPVFSWFVINPILYGKLACIHCKQGSICCPALNFFIKKEKKK